MEQSTRVAKHQGLVIIKIDLFCLDKMWFQVFTPCSPWAIQEPTALSQAQCAPVNMSQQIRYFLRYRWHLSNTQNQGLAHPMQVPVKTPMSTWQKLWHVVSHLPVLYLHPSLNIRKRHQFCIHWPASQQNCGSVLQYHSNNFYVCLKLSANHILLHAKCGQGWCQQWPGWLARINWLL